MKLGKKVSDLRTDYAKGSLNENEVSPNPLHQFNLWFEQAVNAEVVEPNAMSLATVKNGRPSLRIVLLKGYDENGLVWFTNYDSKKGQELLDNPFAALTFFWPELERQVRLEGRVEKISAAESDEYYQSRDKGSRIGAWASPQSSVLSNREALEARVGEFVEKYGEADHIPRPGHWGGYRLHPDLVEFWQGRPSRLHDRIQYTFENGEWKIVRLAP